MLEREKDTSDYYILYTTTTTTAVRERERSFVVDSLVSSPPPKHHTFLVLKLGLINPSVDVACGVHSLYALRPEIQCNSWRSQSDRFVENCVKQKGRVFYMYVSHVQSRKSITYIAQKAPQWFSTIITPRP